MGFGYLLIGYLITFVLYLTVNGLGFGGLALLLGYAMMFAGLSELNRYHHAFSFAKWILIPAFPLAIYDLAQSLSEQLLWNLPLFGASVAGVIEWISFFVLITFNLAMLFGIRMISQSVGIMHMATAATRNSFVVGIYALFYIVGSMPVRALDAARPYVAIIVTLCNLLWIILNLLLLLSCNKNICRAGDEEQPAKPSRFAWINRIGDAYERNRQKAIDNTTKEAEAVLRRRRERREAKRNKKKK
jgi:hypothetical protein